MMACSWFRTTCFLQPENSLNEMRACIAEHQSARLESVALEEKTGQRETVREFGRGRSRVLVQQAWILGVFLGSNATTASAGICELQT